MTPERFDHLLLQYQKNVLSPTEWEELQTAFSEGGFDDRMKAAFDKLVAAEYVDPTWSQERDLSMWKGITEKMGTTEKSQVPEKSRTTEKGVVGIGSAHRKSRFTWWAAAAVLLLSLGGYFYLSNKTGDHPIFVKTTAPADINAPQTNRARITLASGQQIYLDSASVGMLASQGNVQLQKLADGQIAYRGDAESLVLNTLVNPRGSKPVTMTLSDGTKVWLNAASSMTYPVAFHGGERSVEITGEAYFEVAHDPARSFIVKKMHDDAQVQVLGTHFNVNAYDDETSIKITLLEGLVQVAKGNNKSMVRPDQQAQIQNGMIHVIKNIEVDEVMAWKNGRFEFGDASDITAIMRQISRWYDIDVEYQGNCTAGIGGSISRTVNTSQVLKMLEATGVVKFKMEGRKVTVIPLVP